MVGNEAASDKTSLENLMLRIFQNVTGSVPISEYIMPTC